MPAQSTKKTSEGAMKTVGWLNLKTSERTMRHAIVAGDTDVWLSDCGVEELPETKVVAASRPASEWDPTICPVKSRRKAPVIGGSKKSVRAVPLVVSRCNEATPGYGGNERAGFLYPRAKIATRRDNKSDFIPAHHAVAGDGVVAIPVTISVKCCGRRRWCGGSVVMGGVKVVMFVWSPVCYQRRG
ncbi:hypothetical protein E3N88_33668 [Mikania micrantha]|uniref:Uncharacterized protein n=1 Tax=Mikania micrantha TaxID=192012 RepID=A0A5N6MCC7_9ASTR|nr:hypothetical protein E3N88_33668 [Mikania micrantha]